MISDFWKGGNWNGENMVRTSVEAYGCIPGGIKDDSNERQ